MGDWEHTPASRVSGVEATYEDLRRMLVLERFGVDAATTPAGARNDHINDGAGSELVTLGSVRTPRRRYRGWTLASRRAR